MTQKPEKKIITRAEFDEMRQTMRDEMTTLGKQVISEERYQEDKLKKIEGVKFRDHRGNGYLGEVGSKDNDIFYHFFPTSPDGFPGGFQEALHNVYGEVYPFADGMIDYCPDVSHPSNTELLGSWVIRIPGQAGHLFAEKLFVRFFSSLDHRLLQ